MTRSVQPTCSGQKMDLIKDVRLLENRGYIMRKLLIFIMLFLPLGCYEKDSQRKLNSAFGQYVDVTINETRYYGVASENKVLVDGKQKTERSCVVLMPWNNRPECSVSVEEDISTINLEGKDFQIKGCHVCLTDNKRLIVVADELSIVSYDDRELLEKTILNLMTN